MKIRAEYSPRYFRRFLWVALACAAFAAYCFYDGLVAYPKKLEQAKIYWDLDESSRYKKWQEITAEKNWSPEPPDSIKDIEWKIDSQFFMAGVCFVIGIPCLLKWFLARGSWMESTETGIQTSWGPQLEFDQVISIDKSRWESKGIAKINFEDESSRPKSFVLDDFKFDREAVGEMLKQVESRLKPEQIIGGPAEGADEDEPVEATES